MVEEMKYYNKRGKTKKWKIHQIKYPYSFTNHEHTASIADPHIILKDPQSKNQ